MNKLLNISLVSIITIVFGACASSSSPSLSSIKDIDVEKVCSVENNGIEKVIQTAKKYNEIAKKNELEFRRLGVNNTDLIISVEEAIKTGAKEVNPKDFKGKASKTKLPIDFAAIRACKFAITALTQANEAKTSWRLAVPGDGYEY
ncbi:hypothetical protein [Malaciobacter marinus]|jgi:hypothetical protein|uniref:hypothetical protein n=1 Tax=Malaciobacter marinus TaxID=505249 RepID=UPI0009D3D93B|nr:hypothetical protein [Malaciobacter marinus]SKB30676.1 hypothetical protein SAMN06295997_104111 [Malaciobacter marinus]